jgi:hypothetical protein
MTARADMATMTHSSRCLTGLSAKTTLNCDDAQPFFDGD